MVHVKKGHRKICERCLAIASDTICPRCGYTRLSEVSIALHDGNNNDASKLTKSQNKIFRLEQSG
jgi:predicted nucleic-acid-binding Zn-ribbon protein